ncbi:hypothetical protein DMC64_22650 [Amycolatopsis sp. WAC 04197]|nr:hypothetical protein DMC64_22650 [Amycolatopsis sp. WAC 04197]
MTALNNPNEATLPTGRRDFALVVQCACTALVAIGAAYASHRHGRDFALQFGADHTTAAAIWPHEDDRTRPARSHATSSAVGESQRQTLESTTTTMTCPLHTKFLAD